MWTTKQIKDTLVRACAWCNKVFVDGKWVEAHTEHKQDKITHGICTECVSTKFKR